MSDGPLLSPEVLLAAYERGWFPMMHEDGDLYWHDPDPRAIFQLDAVQPNARLRRFLRSSGFTCTVDTSFEAVMRACADRPERWINEEMIQAYTALHRQGHALCVETWLNGELIGGIYGVRLGRAFFGESMFSRRANASKAAFFHLAEHLRANGFTLFDTQYLNDHTRSLGAVEITRVEFRRMLAEALR